MNVDLEGLEQEEQSVIEAIKKGAKSIDSNIHPDHNGLSRPIAKTDLSKSKTTWIQKIKEKIQSIKKKDNEIYPLF